MGWVCPPETKVAKSMDVIIPASAKYAREKHKNLQYVKERLFFIS